MPALTLRTLQLFLPEQLASLLPTMCRRDRRQWLRKARRALGINQKRTVW